MAGRVIKRGKITIERWKTILTVYVEGVGSANLNAFEQKDSDDADSHIMDGIEALIELGREMKRKEFTDVLNQ